MEPGTCTAPHPLLWEARNLPQTLQRALEKVSKKVFCSWTALQHSTTTLVHSFHSPPSPDLFYQTSEDDILLPLSFLSWLRSLRPPAQEKHLQFPWSVANRGHGQEQGKGMVSREGWLEWFHCVCYQDKWSWKGLEHFSLGNQEQLVLIGIFQRYCHSSSSLPKSPYTCSSWTPSPYMCTRISLRLSLDKTTSDPFNKGC